VLETFVRPFDVPVVVYGQVLAAFAWQVQLDASPERHNWQQSPFAPPASSWYVGLDNISLLIREGDASLEGEVSMQCKRVGGRSMEHW